MAAGEQVLIRGLSQTKDRFLKLDAQIIKNERASNRAAAIIVKRAIKAEAKKIRGAGQFMGFTKRGKPRVRHPLESTVRIVPVGRINFLVGPHTPLAHLIIKGHGPAGHTNPEKGPERPITGGFAGSSLAHAALSWEGSGGTVFAASSPGGWAKANPFVARALNTLTRVEAITAAREVLLANMPGPADI